MINFDVKSRLHGGCSQSGTRCRYQSRTPCIVRGKLTERAVPYRLAPRQTSSRGSLIRARRPR